MGTPRRLKREPCVLYATGVGTSETSKEGTLRAVCHGCGHTQTSKGEPYMLYATGVGTPRLLKGEPYATYTKGVGTPRLLKREPYMPYVVGGHTHTSKREPYTPYLMGGHTTILQRGNLTSIPCGCEHTHTVREETSFTVCCRCRVIYTFSRGRIIFSHAVHRRCVYSYRQNHFLACCTP